MQLRRGRVPAEVGIGVGGGGEGWGPSWERAAVEADGEQDVEEREGEKERECGVVGLDWGGRFRKISCGHFLKRTRIFDFFLLHVEIKFAIGIYS